MLNCNYKSSTTKKKAFTLIELLIVIAIIGILFIVLVSKVDFATDKAKASGVQTTFRSFQVALEMVSKENAGFNTFGWDTGDNGAGVADGGTITINGKNYTYTNASKDAGDRIRNSYDEGDTNLNGQYNDGEVWTGRKVYTETWTGCYTLINPGNSSDMSAIFDLETAINKNLDPKLHIVIADDGTISMANGYKDPWSTQYHGRYITNASADAAAKWNTDASMTGSTGDNMDRGAILMYSNGANQKFGTKVKIVGGVVTATVSQIDADHPDNNKMGADDYVLAVVYSYTNGYGETMAPTWGFTPDNKPLTGNGGNMDNNLIFGGNEGQQPETPDDDITNTGPGLYKTGSNYTEMLYTWDELVALNGVVVTNGELSYGNGTKIPENLPEKNSYGFYYDVMYGNEFDGMLFKPDGTVEFYWNGAIDAVLSSSEVEYSQHQIYIPEWGNTILISDDGITMTIYEYDIVYNIGGPILCGDLWLPNDGTVTAIAENGFAYHSGLTGIKLSDNVTYIGRYAFESCSLQHAYLGNGLQHIGESAFYASALISINIPNCVTEIDEFAFAWCESLTNITLSNNISKITRGLLRNCTSLQNVKIPEGVTVIDEFAFQESNIKNVGPIGSGAQIELPNSLMQIGNYSFSSCDSLLSVVLPDNVAEIGRGAFQSCPSLSTFRYSHKITYTGESIFIFCDSLISVGPEGSGAAVEIPSNIITISDSTFSDCTALIRAELPNTVKTLSYGAFKNCSSLKHVKLSTSITSIGMMAFAGCTNITSMGNIGSGADFEMSSSVQYIGTLAFDNTGLVRIELPEGVKTLDTSAFRNCEKLTSVSLPSTLTSIGNYAFGDCLLLTNITLPASISSIGSAVFYKSAVKTVNFEGTKVQWNQLTITKDWDKQSIVEEIICSDGSLTP